MAVWELQKSLLGGTASTFQWRFVGIHCEANADPSPTDSKMALKNFGSAMAGKMLTVILIQLAKRTFFSSFSLLSFEVELV